MQPFRKPFILFLIAIFLLGASVPIAFAQSNDQQNDRKQGRKKEPKKDEQKAVSSANTATPEIDPKLYSAMKWRLIGPFRGGRGLGGYRRHQPAQHLLHGRSGRRSVENH